MREENKEGKKKQNNKTTLDEKKDEKIFFELIINIKFSIMGRARGGL